jgi:hypothetical protein
MVSWACEAFWFAAYSTGMQHPASLALCPKLSFDSGEETVANRSWSEKGAFKLRCATNTSRNFKVVWLASLEETQGGTTDLASTRSQGEGEWNAGRIICTLGWAKPLNKLKSSNEGVVGNHRCCIFSFITVGNQKRSRLSIEKVLAISQDLNSF